MVTLEKILLGLGLTVKEKHSKRIACQKVCKQLYSRPQTLPKSRKTVWCCERHFLSHGAGPNGVKNGIITFYIWDSSFLTTWTATLKGMRNRLLKIRTFNTRHYIILTSLLYQIQTLTSRDTEESENSPECPHLGEIKRMCKQCVPGADSKVKVNIQSPIPASFPH